MNVSMSLRKDCKLPTSTDIEKEDASTLSLLSEKRGASGSQKLPSPQSRNMDHIGKKKPISAGAVLPGCAIKAAERTDRSPTLLALPLSGDRTGLRITLQLNLKIFHDPGQIAVYVGGLVISAVPPWQSPTRLCATTRP